MVFVSNQSAYNFFIFEVSLYTPNITINYND